VPEYIKTEDTFIAKGAGARDLVVRPRDRDDGYYDDDVAVRRRSVREDYGGRRARSSGYRDRDSYYDDDYSDDYSRKSHHGRRSRYDDEQSYYSDDYERPRERRKSRVGEALEGIGLGGVVAAVTGRSRSRRRRSSGGSDRSHYSRSRDRSRSRDTRKKWQQAAKAAVITGVIEAVHSRNAPGPWTGQKGQRVVTAALGAAGIDGLLDRDPDRKSKRHIVESVVGGLLANRVANGSTKDTEGRGRSLSRSRSRSRSRSVVNRIRSRSRSIFGRSASRGRSNSRGRTGSGPGSGLKDLAVVGVVATAGKALYDRVRSKSRGRDDRGRNRDRSVSSEDSYVPSRQQRYGQRSRGGPDRDFGPPQGDERGRGAEQGPGGANRTRSASSSSISTVDLEKKRRETRTKEFLTAGLATVATIHAAHGVYNSMVASEKRHKMVLEGEMSPEEARKRKSKNIVQDVAAVGIAALGIKSAFSEWKEMNESRKEKHEIEARHRKHRKARERKQQEMQNPNYGSPQGYGPYGGYPPPAGPGYGDANPFQAYAGSLPPPPMGGPPR
jgi:hypothetical protein